MPYHFLAIAVLIPLAVICGLASAYIKRSSLRFAVQIVFLFGTPYLAYKLYERNFQLDVIPDALGVISVSYSKEESWGFGPGGNEAGIRVYPLPENVSLTINARGIEFFKDMPKNKAQQQMEWRGVYSNWKETPIKPDRKWGENKTSGSLNVYDYVCAYGFCIDIKSAIVKDANSAINNPGSYYAYGRIGLIVVSPKKNLVMYFYNG